MGRRQRIARTVGRFVRRPLVVVCLLSLIVAVAGFSDSGGELGSINLTSGGIAWVTTMEADELEPPEDKITLVEQGENGQEFNSMESMLQWAIGHSDPEKLKMAAKDAKRLTPEELERRRNDIKELMDRLRVPSDAELMKVAIADLLNSTLSSNERQRALQELLILVEPIDNANALTLVAEDVADLDKLGGILPLIAELKRPEVELRTTAAWVLGKACQNNLVVQKQVLLHGGLPRLMEMVDSSSPEEAVKALYAVSAVIRNFPLGQEAFYSAGGAVLLEKLLGGASVDLRLSRKSLFLIADLAEQSHQLHEEQLDSVLKVKPTMPGPMDLLSRRLLKAVVKHMEASDLDTQEKALMAVRSLSKVSGRVRRELIDACEIEATLERVKLQLHELQDQDQADFAWDLEVLRQEVASFISNSEKPSDTEGLRDGL